MLKFEAPILWPLDAKSQFIRKDPDAWKDWRQEEKGMTEDKMIRWHHKTQLNMSLRKLRETVKDREASVLQSTGSQRVGHDRATEQQQMESSLKLKSLWSSCCQPYIKWLHISNIKSFSLKAKIISKLSDLLSFSTYWIRHRLWSQCFQISWILNLSVLHDCSLVKIKSSLPPRGS